MKQLIPLIVTKKKVAGFIKKNIKPLFLLFFTWGMYFALFWPRMLYSNKTGDLVAGWRNIWGDWAMHITQAHAFAYQPILHVLQNHPIYSGIPLSYPFTFNLISGLLLRLGVNTVSAFIIPSLIVSFFLLFGLYILGKHLTGSSRQTLLAVTLFLTSGGLGFIHYFKDLAQNFSLKTALYPPHEYTHMKDIGYYWTTTLLAHLVPQRAFLLGMTFGLFILYFLFSYYQKSFKDVSLAKMLSLGLVSGLLAYIHNHTLAMLFFLSAYLFLFDLKHYKHWLSFALGTSVSALPFFIFFSGPDYSQYIQFLPGWLSHPRELNIPFWWFWLKNWGLMIPLFIVGMFVGKQKPKTGLFISGFIFIFLLANLFTFQPSSWDNAKLLLWVYLIFSFVVAGFLLTLWEKHLGGKILAALLFLCLTASGGIDLVRVLNTQKESYMMVSGQEIELAKFLREHSKPKDIVLTSDNHLHWVPLASGRSIVMGYRGWLWSHGINYNQRQKDITQIYRGTPQAKTLLQKYNIRFVVTDRKTQEELMSNEKFFKENYHILIASPYGNVYEIK
ncbi:MAG: hypothetical protein ACOX6V_02335 [Patescibacteria group bacterium]|jgi:hypothetical protein